MKGQKGIYVCEYQYYILLLFMEIPWYLFDKLVSDFKK
jgi:hypothetical protein